MSDSVGLRPAAALAQEEIREQENLVEKLVETVAKQERALRLADKLAVTYEQQSGDNEPDPEAVAESLADYYENRPASS